jgi:hypothetical protein
MQSQKWAFYIMMCARRTSGKGTSPRGCPRIDPPFIYYKALSVSNPLSISFEPFENSAWPRANFRHAMLANKREKVKWSFHHYITQLMNNSGRSSISIRAAVNLGQMSNRILVRLQGEFMRLIKDRSGCRQWGMRALSQWNQTLSAVKCNQYYFL